MLKNDASLVKYLAADQIENGENIQKIMLFWKISEIYKAFQNRLKYIDAVLKRF